MLSLQICFPLFSKPKYVKYICPLAVLCYLRSRKAEEGVQKFALATLTEGKALGYRICTEVCSRNTRKGRIVYNWYVPLLSLGLLVRKVSISAFINLFINLQMNLQMNLQTKFVVVAICETLRTNQKRFT